MGIQDQLKNDLRQAMRERREVAVRTIRMLLSEIRNREIELRREASDEDILGVLERAAKTRRESIQQFTVGGRSDLASQEAAELTLIERYLPPKMGVEQLRKVISEVIAETAASGAADFGKTMKAIMSRVGRAADGAEVSRLLKEILK